MTQHQPPDLTALRQLLADIDAADWHIRGRLDSPTAMAVQRLLHIAIAQARDAGLDVDEIMADELRDMGYVVVRGEVDWPGPDTWEDNVDPPPRPHPDWHRFGLVDQDPPS